MAHPDMSKIIPTLRREVGKFQIPIVEVIAKKKRDPFRILVSTMLSLRTKDETTAGASARLFTVADTPGKIIKLSHKRLEKLIYPVGFYRTKAKSLKKMAAILLREYYGKVPDTIEQLIELPGVGRKTANLVVSLGFNKEGLCVDTHVHRIMNRFGYIQTNNPYDTEFALRKKLPKKYWKYVNVLLVMWGQNICTPISPKCSLCALRPWCKRVGVRTSR